MFECTVKVQSADGGKRKAMVQVRGKATVEHARELRERLAEGFGEANGLRMSIAEVTEADLTLLQLIASARMSAAAAGASFELEGEEAEWYRLFLKEAGFVSDERAEE